MILLPQYVNEFSITNTRPTNEHTNVDLQTIIVIESYATKEELDAIIILEDIDYSQFGWKRISFIKFNRAFFQSVLTLWRLSLHPT